MNAPTLAFTPIGVIRSGHTEADDTPIQPVFAEGCAGRVEVLSEYAEGLKDLAGFSHIYLLYHLHKAAPALMLVKPFLQDVEHGVFATRSPRRPNAIGLSIVRLVRCDGNVLHVQGVDVLDGTPLLDIKPYCSRFDRIDTTRNGWQDGVDESTAARRGRRGYGKAATIVSGRPADGKCGNRGKGMTMPKNDGKGPSGKGAGTGRGRGPCGGGKAGGGPRGGPGMGRGLGSGRGTGRGRGGGQGLGSGGGRGGR